MVFADLNIISEKFILFQKGFSIERLKLDCELRGLLSVNPDEDDAALTFDDVLGLGLFEDLILGDVFLISSELRHLHHFLIRQQGRFLNQFIFNLSFFFDSSDVVFCLEFQLLKPDIQAIVKAFLVGVTFELMKQRVAFVSDKSDFLVSSRIKLEKFLFVGR